MHHLSCKNLNCNGPHTQCHVHIYLSTIYPIMSLKVSRFADLDFGSCGLYALNEVNTDDCLVLATSKSNYMYLNVYTQTKILAC